MYLFPEMTYSIRKIFDTTVEMNQSVVDLDQLIFNILLIGIEIQSLGLYIFVPFLKSTEYRRYFKEFFNNLQYSATNTVI